MFQSRKICTVVLLLFNLSLKIYGASRQDFFPFGSEQGDKKLDRKDEVSTSEIKLNTPFLYFNENFESFFVNSNGLISFLTEIPYFFNSEFPLDYPIIAPFYSDVDISATGNVYYRESTEKSILERVSTLVQRNFEKFKTFDPSSVIIVTWDAVGAYKTKTDKVNTFQAVLATNTFESFVIFNYLDNGIEWVQGDGKTSGLEDALGQAGFVSSGGQYFTLKWSGKDQVRNLDKWSNIGIPGVWIYEVGRSKPSKVGKPNEIDTNNGTEFTRCTTKRFECHSKALCNDYDGGFCCECNEKFYGNGINCLSKEKPIRVNGKVDGNINGADVKEADLHAYVLSSEGRSYTAISRIPTDIGYDIQCLTQLAEGVAWLFAIPVKNVPIGFDYTGGHFNRTVEVNFPQTGHSALIRQFFKGLDVFNNVAVDTVISGTVPTVPLGTELELEPFQEEFTRVQAGQIRAYSSRKFKLKGQTLETPYTVQTTINFNACEYENIDDQMHTLRLKVGENIFVKFDKAESIIRYSFTSKIGNLEEEDPCIEGKKECGENSQCIVDGFDFRCICEPGFELTYNVDEKSKFCLEMNECKIGRHTCHSDATCINVPGSYVCRCNDGFAGNGHYCDRQLTCASAKCDPNAECQIVNDEPRCICRANYKGNGLVCSPENKIETCEASKNCSPYAICEPVLDEYKCKCLEGYKGDGYTCELQRVHDIITEESALYPYEPYPQTAGPNLDRILPECTLTICYCPSGYRLNDREQICIRIIEETEIHEYLEPNCNEENQCQCPVDHLYNPISRRCELISDVIIVDSPIPVCFDGNCICPLGYNYNKTGPHCKPSNVEGYDYAVRGGASPCTYVNNCHRHAECVHSSNSSDGYCMCKAGFTGDGYMCRLLEASCNEDCNVNADCIFDEPNQSFKCVCKEGFYGDGVFCHSLDDCDSSLDCDKNAQCVFNEISRRHECRCNEYFKGDGFYCTRTREESCMTLENCHIDAECVLDHISRQYRCRCKHGYEGNGLQCNKIIISCNVVNNCGPKAECSYDPMLQGYECKCQEGFKGDGFFCRPSQSCRNKPDICHLYATCQPTNDEFNCVCHTGYSGDGYSCEKIPDYDKNILLINQGISILRMPTNPGSKLGYGVPIIVDPFMTAVGSDIDCLSGRYYWTDVSNGRIWSSNYDGSERKEFLTPGSPEDLSIDWMSKIVYWTDAQNDVIIAADLEAFLIRTVVKDGLVNPRGVAVHPESGLLFWTDWNRAEPKIEKSGMDGSDRQILVSEDISLPNCLSIDFEANKLCWVDAGTGTVECVGMDGQNRVVVSRARVHYPFDLTINQDSLFYTDWEDERVHKVNKYTGVEEKAYVPPPGGSGKLYGIAAVPESCPTFRNVCHMDRGNCPGSHLCLPNGKGGRTCGCPDNTSEECYDYQY